MRTLTERFLFEAKRSEIRKYKNAEKNPPKWYNIDNIVDNTTRKQAHEDRVSEYGMGECVYDMVCAFIKDTPVEADMGSFNKWVITSLWKDNDLRNMCQAYLEEFIDLKQVPFVVMCAMIDDLMKVSKVKSPEIKALVNYITK